MSKSSSSRSLPISRPPHPPHPPPLQYCSVCSNQSSLRCSNCLGTLYCSVMCQRKDWKTHKVTCKEAEKLIKILEKDPCRTVDEIDAQLEKYRRLAELGDPSVQYNVGYMYFYGVGVCVDQVESAKW